MRVLDPERNLWSTGKVLNPSAQRVSPGDDEYYSVNGKEEPGNRLEHWLRKTNTALGDDATGNISVAGNNDKGVLHEKGNEKFDRWVWLLEVREMVDQAVLESEKKTDSQVAESAKIEKRLSTH